MTRWARERRVCFVEAPILDEETSDDGTLALHDQGVFVATTRIGIEAALSRNTWEHLGVYEAADRWRPICQRWRARLAKGSLPISSAPSKPPDGRSTA
jgi:hypothetical protein